MVETSQAAQLYNVLVERGAAVGGLFLRRAETAVITARTTDDAIAGGIRGLLIGDAAGVPYEFHRGLERCDPQVVEMPPPAGFPRSHPNAPPQAWSDDGAHALCLLASLLDCGRLDLDDLGRRLLRWGSDAELVRDAGRQSLVTHGHVRSQVCCALYCLWVRAALRGADDPWVDAVQRLRDLASQEPAWASELDEHVHPEWEPHGRGSGYVVDCLHSARLAAGETNFEDVIRKAISLGDDTDTTAAVAGGFAGVRHGLSGIPERWRAALAGRAIAEPLVAGLLERWR